MENLISSSTSENEMLKVSFWNTYTNIVHKAFVTLWFSSTTSRNVLKMVKVWMRLNCWKSQMFAMKQLLFTQCNISQRNLWRLLWWAVQIRQRRFMVFRKVWSRKTRFIRRKRRPSKVNWRGWLLRGKRQRALLKSKVSRNKQVTSRHMNPCIWIS